MADPKISSFIISLILVGFFAGVFSIYIANINTNYAKSYSDINESLAVYDQLDEINKQSKEIKEATNIKEKTGILDIIGGYFSSAYGALQLTAKSFNLFDKMSKEAVDQAGLGDIGELLRVTISTIVIVLIFIGVFLSALMKWRL